MDLVGKTVRIHDVGLLEFFYPNYIKKEAVLLDSDKDIIYVGKMRPNLRNYLILNCKSFINTVGVPDIDLEEKESLLNFVYDKFGKIPKKSLVDIICGLQKEDFYHYIKSYWVLGKSKLEEEMDFTIFNLFIAMTKSGMEALKIYSYLLDYYEPPILNSSIETFLEKASDINEGNASSSSYTRILKDFNSKHHKTFKILLKKYYEIRGSKQNKIMWLLYNL